MDNLDSEAIAKQCIKAAIAVSVVLTVLLWGDWFSLLLVWIFMYPMALVFGFITGFWLSAIGATEPEERVWIEDEEDEESCEIIVLEYSPATLGRFNDSDIHEWVIIKRPDTGEAIRLEYDRCVSFDADFEAPHKRWFAILAGVVYVEPENSTSEE